MMLFLGDNGEQRQFLCKIDYSIGKLDTITTHAEILGSVWEHTHNDVLQFFLRDQEYLVIPCGLNIYLKPYRLNSKKEKQQATITVKLANEWDETEHQRDLCHFFGYKDKLYCFTRERGSFRKFFTAEFFCVNLTEKKSVNGIITVKREDMSIFKPQKISAGTFRTEKALTGWQEGKMVVLTETQPWSEKRPSTDLGDRFWIIDLEKETIQERLVESTRLKRATLYQEEWIMLWNLPYEHDRPKRPPTKIKYKQILRTDIVPRLKSICSAKLLSQKGIEKNEVAQRFINQ